ncbi:MAG: hypothetical protein HC934_00350 [Acaryochloridaceae cyanobacterium SU_2_1]|nr:hypothetical protein [Acaryochloridaceae cyanobacterium SU_2_1]
MPSRALLKEHGQLLHWQGREAHIGIRKTLLRLAAAKVTELEETFEKCFNRKVKVSLRALTEEQMQSQPGASKASMQSKPAPISVAPAPAPAPAVSPSRLTQEYPAAANPPAQEVTAPPSSPKLSGQDHEEDLATAAQSFAEFFNGAFVNTEPVGEEPTA